MYWCVACWGVGLEEEAVIVVGGRVGTKMEG